MFEETTKKEITTAVKELVKNALVNLVAKDLRPFHIVNGIGFRELIDAISSVSLKYGRFEVDKLLCDSSTISRHMDVEYSVVMKRLQSILKQEYSKSFFGVKFSADGLAAVKMNINPISKGRKTDARYNNFRFLANHLNFSRDIPDNRQHPQ